MGVVIDQIEPKRGRRAVLSVPVCLASMEETVAAMGELIEGGGSHLVATADASGIVIAQDDPELMKIYQEASWVTADSYGVVWGLKLKGESVGRVSGVDLADELIKLSAQKGYRVFLLGSDVGVADAAKEQLLLKHPGCNIVGAHHGFFPESEDMFMAEQVAEFKPDILLVAMGIPRQEKFLAKTKDVIGFKIGMGVGGTLDVMSGRVKRAPKLIQSLRIEWLWRTLMNPKKISKAKTLPIFAVKVLRDRS